MKGEPKMANKPKTNPEVTEEVTKEPVVPKKVRQKREVTPETELKKKIKELQKENEALKIKLEQSEAFVKSAAEQRQHMENAINELQIKYTRITEYIKRSLSVFHQSVLMAFEEEVK